MVTRRHDSIWCQPQHALFTHHNRHYLTYEAERRYVYLSTCRDRTPNRREEYQDKEKSTVLLEPSDEPDDECEDGNKRLTSVFSGYGGSP